MSETFTDDGGLLPAWSDTPLGRWQAKVREERAREEAALETMDAPPAPTPAEIFAARSALEQRRKEARAALVRFHAARRRAIKMQRSAAWADQAAIRRFYEEARALSSTTGEPYHVDHIIPLQGALVSGLHVEQNLQIIRGAENSRKRNKFEVQP